MKHNLSSVFSKTIFSGGIALFLLLPLFSTQAQEEPNLPTPSESQEEAIMIANINVYEAQIEKQEGNQVTISFIISNDEDNYYSDIYYGLEVLKLTPITITNPETNQEEETTQQELLDFVSYPQDALALKPHQKIKKQISYTLPKTSGTLQFWIKAFNETGLLYGLGMAGEVTLDDPTPVQLNSESCYLTVGQKEDQYSLWEGVSLKPEEELNLFCTLENTTNQDQIISISSKTYQRTYVTGQEINIPGYQETIILASQQKKEIKIPVPKPNQPQAYDTVFTFQTSDFILPKVAAHYVVSGSSATFQLLKIDKDYYQKGDTAKVSVFWTPAADIFPQSRIQTNQENLKIKLQIISQTTNQACAPEQTFNLDQSKTFQDFNISITQNCPNPKVLGQILENDQVLAQKEVALTSTSQPQPQPTTAKTQAKTLSFFLLAAVLIALFIFLVFLFWKKKTTPPLAFSFSSFSFWLGSCGEGKREGRVLQ